MSITQSPFIWYDKSFSHLSLPGLLTDAIKVALCTGSYIPNVATHEFFDVSVTNELTTANGYTAGGIALASKTLTAGGAAGQWIFGSADPTWDGSGSGLLAKLFVLYNSSPSSNKPLLGYGYLNYNGGSPVDVSVPSGFPLAITIPATGWFYTEKVNGV